VGAFAAEPDAPLPVVIDDVQLRGGVEVDAVGLGAEVQRPSLLPGGPAVGGIDIRKPVQALDLHVAHIAHGEVGVQRLAEGHGVGATVMTGQADVQVIVQAQAQLQVDLMRPAGEAARGYGEHQVDAQGVTFEFGGGQFPECSTHETVAPAGWSLWRMACTLCGLRSNTPNHGQHTGTPVRMPLPALKTAALFGQISGCSPARW